MMCATISQLWKALTVVRYVYPTFAFLYFGVASLASVFTSQKMHIMFSDQHVKRKFLWLMLLATLGYVLQAFLLALKSLQKGLTAGQDEIIYLVFSAIVWAVHGLALRDSNSLACYPYYVNWTIATLVELFLLITPVLLIVPQKPVDFTVFALRILQICNFIALLGLYLSIRSTSRTYARSDEERQPLLNNHGVPNQTDPGQISTGYRAIASSSHENDNGGDTAARDDEWNQKRIKKEKRRAKNLEEAGNWWAYIRRFGIFWQYIWPSQSKRLQTRVFLVMCCLVGETAISFLIPRQSGTIIDALVDQNVTGISIYLLLVFAKSGAGLAWIRKYFWEPVEEYAYKELSTAAQTHVLHLSYDFHSSKNSNDVFMTTFKGRSIIGLVRKVCLEVLPMCVDLILACVSLYGRFGPYMGLELLATTLVFFYTTLKVTAISTALARDRSKYYTREWQSQKSTIHHWPLATLFNNIPHEEQHYRNAVTNNLKHRRKDELMSQKANAIKSFVLVVGMLGACLIAVPQILSGVKSPGDFSVLIAYWFQMQSSLLSYGNMSQQISEDFMNAESLLEQFEEETTVVDEIGAKPLLCTNGAVHFNNVSFSYNDRNLHLKGIDFKVKGGSKIAIVGQTGGGKTTIFKVLLRLLNLTEGTIEIDGQNIKNITLTSLRDIIGMVPQDILILNDTILENVRCAKEGASDEEVYAACKSAWLHDKVMNMPKGYKTMPGEEGGKISGGEKQRIAIARLILKDPRILLLDEATSAVDGETENKIQGALEMLCKGRTTFMIAHRLSTIVRADRIFVIEDGKIIEDGTHAELKSREGKYYNMWMSQIQNLGALQ